MTAAALQLRDVSGGYQSSLVLHRTSLAVAPAESVALLGKNGMGKTTLLKAVMGHLPKTEGSIHLGGVDITRYPPHRIARMGVAYASQERALFADLSIRDNLRLGLESDALFGERFAAIEPVFPLFSSRLAQAAGTLSGGEQKMLLVARALMMRPSVLLLDEISEGVQPTVIERIAGALRWERQQRATTLLIVEQNVSFALDIADRYVVMKQGTIVDEGSTRAAGAKPAIFEHLKV